MAPTVLVTGARGFLGRHVSRQLAQAGSEVTGVGRGDWPGAQAREWGIARWVEGGLTEATLRSLPQAGLIVHCAGAASVLQSFDDPLADFKSNVATTAVALALARRWACPMVQVSSAAVYGETKAQPIREDAPLQPMSPYGFHKLLAENLCGWHARRFGLRVSIVRFFSIYGPGLRKQLLWDACRKAARGDFEFAGTGREARDWLHVEDAARLAIAAAAHASQECPAVNGGSGSAVEIRDLLALLLRELGASGQLRFTGSGRAGDPGRYEADIGRAASLGWRPAIALAQGLSEYARWFADGGN